MKGTNIKSFEYAVLFCLFETSDLTCFNIELPGGWEWVGGQRL